MALDILILGSHNEVEKNLPLNYEDYEYIMSRIEKDNDFPLLNRIFFDYYGEEQVYLNDLENLKEEILYFDKKNGSSFPPTVAEYTAKLLNIVEHAIQNRKTIKIIGD